VIKVTAAQDGSCDISNIADLATLAAEARQKRRTPANVEMNMKTFIGTVGACLLLIIGAGAQAQPAPEAQPGNVTPGSLARFKLEAVSFRALDETGIDLFGSDEVYVTIHVPATDVATRSQVFEDVDAGETKNIPLDQSCILPIAGVSGRTSFSAYGGDRWRCSSDGAPGPFSFTVVLRERDERVINCFLPPSCGFTPGSVAGEEPPPFGDLDDLIGRHKVVYSMEKLMALQVGQSKEENSLVTGGDGIYQFNWRITRLPDAEPVVSPVTRLHEPGPVTLHELSPRE
jgi:hypothetical protein